jgi:hypothetical protein
MSSRADWVSSQRASVSVARNKGLFTADVLIRPKAR